LEVTLFVKVVQQVKVHGRLGLHKGIVALIELLFNSLVISIGSDGKHLSPEAIILTVRETEYVVLSYQKYLCENKCHYQ
jgi:hypothetical protein